MRSAFILRPLIAGIVDIVEGDSIVKVEIIRDVHVEAVKIYKDGEWVFRGWDILGPVIPWYLKVLNKLLPSKYPIPEMRLLDE